MICIAWNGFPQYAAHCVSAFVRSVSEKVVVIGTIPDVPIKGMEDIAGCKVLWINEHHSGGIKDLCGELPRAMLVSGWATPAFNHFRDEVRSSGGRVIAAVDNNFVFSCKELLKALRFRLQLRKKFDGFMVPGRSGEKLLKFYGVPETDIYRGLYAASSEIFSGGRPLPERPKRVLYVGRLCGRKNVLGLSSAFLGINPDLRKGWELEICGCGPQKEKIPDDLSIRVHDFVQPEELARIYRQARVFCLPSLEEHWGLVVHEAVLSGCVLVLSDAVGALPDFLAGNGFSYPASDTQALKAALIKAISLSEEQLRNAESISRYVASKTSPALFAEELLRFVTRR